MMSIFASVLWLVASGPLWKLYRMGFTLSGLSIDLGSLSPSLIARLISAGAFKDWCAGDFYRPLYPLG